MYFSRKNSSIFLAVLVMVCSWLAPSEVRALSPLSELTEIAKAFGQAGESLGKIANGFSELVKHGLKSYSLISAKMTSERLKDLSAKSTQLLITQSAGVSGSLGNYLGNPDPKNWEAVTMRMEEVLREVNELLAVVKEERSDFVLEQTYFDMVSTLQSRDATLQRLIKLPPPTTKAELAELKKVDDQYQKLVNNLHKAVKELNAYIKMLE